MKKEHPFIFLELKRFKGCFQEIKNISKLLNNLEGDGHKGLKNKVGFKVGADLIFQEGFQLFSSLKRALLMPIFADLKILMETRAMVSILSYLEKCEVDFVSVNIEGGTTLMDALREVPFENTKVVADLFFPKLQDSLWGRYFLSGECDKKQLFRTRAKIAFEFWCSGILIEHEMLEHAKFSLPKFVHGFSWGDDSIGPKECIDAGAEGVILKDVMEKPDPATVLSDKLIEFGIL